MQLSSLLIALLPLLQPAVTQDEATLLRATTFLNPPSSISIIVDPFQNKSTVRSVDVGFTGTCDLKLFKTQPSFDYQPCSPPTFQIKYAKWADMTRFSFEVAHAVNYPSNGVYIRKATQTIDVAPSPVALVPVATVPASLQRAPEGWAGDTVAAAPQNAATTPMSASGTRAPGLPGSTFTTSTTARA